MEDLQEEIEEINKEPHVDGWASSIVFVISFVGLAVNLFNFIIFIKIRRSRGSFAYLWAARCGGIIYILLIYLIYPTPTIIRGLSPYSESVGEFIAITITAPYTLIILLQPLLALHLFIICYFPFSLKFIYEETSVLIQIAICFLFGIVLTVLWIIFSCRSYYDIEWFSWEWECVDWLNNISDSYLVPTTLAITIILYVFILIKLIKIKGIIDEKRRHRKNLRIMITSILQDSIFALDIFMQDTASLLYEDKWWYFICNTVSWEMSHTIDGRSYGHPNSEFPRASSHTSTTIHVDLLERLRCEEHHNSVTGRISRLGWHTAAVVPELAKEIRTQNSYEFRNGIMWLEALTGLIEKHQILAVKEEETKNIMDEWKEERNHLREMVKSMFNRQFGSIFRTYNNMTYFSRRLNRLSDVYTSRVPNFLKYGVEHSFFPRRNALPHESVSLTHAYHHQEEKRRAQTSSG